MIVNRWTAMPELVIEGKTGEVCEILTKRFSHLGSYTAIPSTASLVEKMIKLHKADRVVMGKAARKHIEENYDTNVVFKEKWLPFLTRLEREVYNTEEMRTPVNQQPNQQ